MADQRESEVWFKRSAIEMFRIFKLHQQTWTAFCSGTWLQDFLGTCSHCLSGTWTATKSRNRLFGCRLFDLFHLPFDKTDKVISWGRLGPKKNLPCLQFCLGTLVQDCLGCWTGTFLHCFTGTWHTKRKEIVPALLKRGTWHTNFMSKCSCTASQRNLAHKFYE